MEHQYPAPISGDESMLAELMLPDQTHVRSQDWTIFFLHKDTSADEDDDSVTGKPKKKKKKKADRSPVDGDPESQDEDADEASEDEEESSDEEEGGEGPPLMYVLNLVNTKQDNTVKRYVIPFPSPHCGRLSRMAKRIYTAVPWLRLWLYVHAIRFFIYTRYFCAQSVFERRQKLT